jgi:hypothetical protein
MAKRRMEPGRQAETDTRFANTTSDSLRRYLKSNTQRLKNVSRTRR